MNQLRLAGAMRSIPHARPLRRRYLRTVGFEFMECLTTCINIYAHIGFCGGFDHGYKQRRLTPLVAEIDNVYNPLRQKMQAILSRLDYCF